MQRTRQVLPIITLLLLVFTGCKKEIQSGQDSPLIESSSVAKSSITAAVFKEKVAQLRTAMPAGFAKQLKASYSEHVNTSYKERVLRALKVIEPTPCNDNTALNQWLDAQLADWTIDDIYFAFDYLLLDLPIYYAWFYETDPKSQTFGKNGQYTQVVNKTFKDLRRFWNIETGDMMVAAMHGTMLTDASKLSSTLQVLFGFDKANGDFFGALISDVVKNNPPYRAGNHPIFTFNAVSIPTTTGIPIIGTTSNKIIMGDGILEAYTALGYDDVAPQAVLAHEFGHQVQFQKDLFEQVESPEATRRTELMADAFSAYYLSHARGAAMEWKRVQQFLQVFYNIGDCAFNYLGHHGTPLQRMAAANWGYNLANNAQKQGHILTGEEFATLFDAQLSQIVSQ